MEGLFDDVDTCSAMTSHGVLQCLCEIVSMMVLKRFARLWFGALYELVEPISPLFVGDEASEDDARHAADERSEQLFAQLSFVSVEALYAKIPHPLVASDVFLMRGRRPLPCRSVSERI